jgi:hypothetical protein
MLPGSNKTNLVGQLSSLSIPNGGLVKFRWVRWLSSTDRPATPIGSLDSEQQNMNVGVDDLIITNTFTPPNSAPSTPLNLNAVAEDAATIALTWEDSGLLENGYIIQRSGTNGGPWAAVGTTAVNVTNFTDVGLIPLTTYYYQVIATNSFGSSAPSTQASATTPANAVSFSSASYSVDETNSAITITVSRAGNVGAASVNFATSNGTAVSPTDYTATNGTLNWTNGESGPKVFNVAIVDRPLIQLSRTFNLTLNSPLGTTLDTPSAATVTITDSDTNGIPTVIINSPASGGVLGSTNDVLNLQTTGTDDGGPLPLTNGWSLVSGPTNPVLGVATFANPAAEDTTVTFNTAGTYRLRLTVGDGLTNASADVYVAVAPTNTVGGSLVEYLFTHAASSPTPNTADVVANALVATTVSSSMTLSDSTANERRYSANLTSTYSDSARFARFTLTGIGGSTIDLSQPGATVTYKFKRISGTAVNPVIYYSTLKIWSGTSTNGTLLYDGTSVGGLGTTNEVASGNDTTPANQQLTFNSNPIAAITNQTSLYCQIAFRANQSVSGAAFTIDDVKVVGNLNVAFPSTPPAAQPILSIALIGGGNAQVNWLAESGRTNQLQSKYSLTDGWSDLGSAIIGTGAVTNVPVSLSTNQQFFRVQVQ